MTNDDKNKIVNTVVYFATKVEGLDKTKLLKLLYLAQRMCVLKYKQPLLNLKFEVWQYGPVASSIYYELSEDTSSIFNGYIQKQYKNNKFEIVPITKFCNDEFSDREIALLNDIVITYGNCSATKLVQVTHSKSWEWYKLAKQNNLLDDFNSKVRTHSDVEIDFSCLLSGCELEEFVNNLETQSFFNSLKS
ncbi:MAG: Panacea domain-containing protein [Rikenellaceae bacterium]